MSFKIINEKLVDDIYNTYIHYKTKNKEPTNIGRPQTINIKHVIILLFKTLRGNKLEDLLDNPKQLSSYEKIARDIRRSGILNNMMKDKLMSAFSEKLIDTTSVQIDSSLIINKQGKQLTAFSYKYKNKKGTLD